MHLGPVLLRRQHRRHAGRAGAGNLAEIERVEGGAQVDVELVVGRAGEHLDAPVKLKDRLLEQRLVLGRGPRPDIARQRDQLLTGGRPQRGALAVLDHHDLVGLAQTDAGGTWPVQRGDGRRDQRRARRDGRRRVPGRGHTVTGSDQRHRHARQVLLRREPDLEANVLVGVLVVVDVELVEKIVVEWEVVRPIAWLEQRIDREDHGHRVRRVRAHERVPVGNVRGTVDGGQWGLAMARSLGRAG